MEISQEELKLKQIEMNWDDDTAIANVEAFKVQVNEIIKLAEENVFYLDCSESRAYWKEVKSYALRILS